MMASTFALIEEQDEQYYPDPFAPQKNKKKNQNCFTTTIIENLKERLENKITVVAISTPEDLGFKRTLGQGYEKVINPYEEEILVKLENNGPILTKTKVNTWDYSYSNISAIDFNTALPKKAVKTFDPKSKNNQIEMIISDAYKKHPTENI